MEKKKNTLVAFLDLLGVKQTQSFSEQYFNEHPHKYNLFGLSKMLTDYGVENAAISIEDKENDITEIEKSIEPDYKKHRKAELIDQLKKIACNPCENMHKRIEDLLSQVNIQLIIQLKVFVDKKRKKILISDELYLPLHLLIICKLIIL